MSNKILFTAIFFLFSLFGFGQVLSKEKSENHIHIKGTNVYMVPPTSFESSTNFKGFQNPNDPNSMIMLIEIPGPYSEVSKGFNPEMLLERGMELKSKKELKVSGLNGLFIELDQLSNGITFSKQVIIYGDDQSTTLINGVYLKNSSEIGIKIKESILTTFVDSETESNPREALKYSLDEKRWFS